MADGCVLVRAPQAAEAAELRKLEETRRRAMAQREVQLQQLEDLKVGGAQRAAARVVDCEASEQLHPAWPGLSRAA